VKTDVDERRRQLSELEAFRRRFVCPDKTGVDAPCSWTQYERPLIDGPFGRTWCPIYQSVGCEPWLAQQERERARAMEQQRRARLARAAARGVPLRFVDASRGEATAAVTMVCEFLAGPARRGRALLIVGPVGRGKTYGAAAGVMEWEDSAYLLEADRLARAAAHDHEELGEIVDMAENVSFLALDDLGRSRWKTDGLAADVLEQIIAHRHAQLMATLITSNWTPAEMRRRLSARVLDRLVEWASVVVVPGASMRTANE
jgi:DNA replication protein DnaC